MLGFGNQLQEKIDTLTAEIESLSKRYYETASIADFALWEYDIPTKTMHLIKKLRGRFSEDNKEIPNYREQMLNWKIIHPEDLEIFLNYCDSMDNGDTKFSYEYRQITDNNIFVWLRTEGTTVYDKANNPRRVIGRTVDINSAHEENALLLERAKTDFLTKLSTKENTYEQINTCLALDEHVTCAFLLLDIDDFKAINDSFGHSFGDSILLQTASILTAQKNNSRDVVGRLGGDEMCVFLYDIKGREDVIDYYNRVKHFLNFVDLGNGEHLRISVGAVLFPEMASNLEELVARSDLALYHTKFTQKDSLNFYDTSMKMDYSSKSLSSRTIENLSAIENIEVSASNALDPLKIKDDLIHSYDALKAIDIAYYIIDKDYRINYCSPNIKSVFPLCEKVILGSHCYETIRKNNSPCEDCPLRNSVNSNIHFTGNYSNSRLDYNVTYKMLNNEENVLLCWNNLTEFTTEPDYVTDYITGMDVYSTFIIKCNHKIKNSSIKYNMVYINLPWFRDFSKGSNFNNAIDLIKCFADFLRDRISSDELITITTPHEFYLLLKDDGNFSKKFRKLITESVQMLIDKFGADLGVDAGYEIIKQTDNNMHIVAMNAKNNIRGY